LELIIYPSYRSTPEKPRFRVGIPTTSYMTADAYNCIIEQLIGRLSAHGYRSKKELDAGARGKHHGVDMSKRHAAALFFFPTLTADPAATFFQHHTGGSRKPLGPRVWLEAAEITLPERMPKDYQRPSQIAPEKLEAVLAEWRMAPQGSGNRAFHRMAWRFLSYGMDVPTIEAVLHNEVQWASAGSCDDRRRQIPYIISDLMRRGPPQAY
jgi:hypothetical protein